MAYKDSINAIILEELHMFKLKRFYLLSLFILKIIFCNAENSQNPPSLEFVMRLDVKIAESYNLGRAPEGIRNIIPIMGGKFEGPKLNGEILEGGADYQLSTADGKINKLEAIYTIKTRDGIYINVRNRGLITMTKDENGEQKIYFKTTPEFEAPIDSKYSWLNQAIFVCEPTESSPPYEISLLVWMVK